MNKRKSLFKNNYKFIDSSLLNQYTYYDYLCRLKKIALSMFEWINLPNSMDSRYIEHCLYYYGCCAFLKDKKFGFINTKATSKGKLNIYGLPTEIHCNSFEYSENRKLFTGTEGFENEIENLQNNSCILVMNDWEMFPTAQSIELFCYRLYN